MRIPFAAPLSILALGVAFALPARAEEGAESDAEKQLKEQVKKVLELMKQNEDALLKASTQGAKDAPQGPDVPVPPESAAPPETAAPPSGTGGAAGSGGGGQGAGGQGAGGQGPSGGGEGAKVALDELLKALQQGGGAIPGEIENLIKMMPT